MTPFEQSPTPPAEYARESQQEEAAMDSSRIADLIARYQKAREEHSRYEPTKETTVEEILAASDSVQTAQRELETAYGKTPDRTLRKTILDTLYDNTREYNDAFSEVENLNLLHASFIKRIGGKNPDIEGARDASGKIIPEQVRARIHAAAEATRFVDTETKVAALKALEKGGIVDVFNGPAEVEKWQPFIESISSTFQASFLDSQVIFNQKPRGPEDLKFWVETSKWINSAEKRNLVEVLILNERWDQVAEWQKVIERICTPVPLVDTDGSIRMGIPRGKFGKLLYSVSDHLGRFGRIFPDDLQQKWDEIISDNER